MLSIDLKKYDFKDWITIGTDYNANKELVLQLPKRKGVYIIRAKKPIGRLQGESNIIYIGQGVIRHRIQALLRQYLPPPYSNYKNKHTARKAFERLMSKSELELELGYLTSENSKGLEKLLLQAYIEQHIEPPPLNNTRE
jgi:hypothetical protein